MTVVDGSAAVNPLPSGTTIQSMSAGTEKARCVNASISALRAKLGAPRNLPFLDNAHDGDHGRVPLHLG